jgi:hypothetical protein
VFDHSSGAVALLNVSLHGQPGHPAARAVGTALVELPGRGWVGNLDVCALDEARLGTESISLSKVAVGIDLAAGVVMASADFPAEDLRARFTAAVDGPALIIDSPIAVRRGWIGWYAWPRLTADGEIRIADQRVRLCNTSAYADHNWGRWHWGEGFGWEWGTFMSGDGGPTVVASQVTDHGQPRHGDKVLELRLAGRQRRFSGHAVSLKWSGVLDAMPRRLPGAMAALHADMAAPRLPAQLTARADDGIDMVEVNFTARAAAQLILADPESHGYSFLHELVGSCSCHGHIQGRDIAGNGLAVVERVD